MHLPAERVGTSLPDPTQVPSALRLLKVASDTADKARSTAIIRVQATLITAHTAKSASSSNR